MISHRNNVSVKPYLCSIAFDQFDCCSITPEGWSISNYPEQSQVYSTAGPLCCVQGKDIICKHKWIAFLIGHLITELVIYSNIWLRFHFVIVEKGNTNHRPKCPITLMSHVWNSLFPINDVDVWAACGSSSPGTEGLWSLQVEVARQSGWR